eukprot:181584_1
MISSHIEYRCYDQHMLRVVDSAVLGRWTHCMIFAPSRLAANLSFFLPYACTLLGANYFSSSNVDQHMTGHRREDEDDDDFDRYSVLIHSDSNNARGVISEKDEAEDLSGKELRDKNDSVYRLRKENARIFKTLALYIQQNVIKEEKGKTAVHLSDIDMNDVAKLQRYPQPDWSKVDSHCRQTYVGIYDVVSHIATALMASWTMDEASTLLTIFD